MTLLLGVNHEENEWEFKGKIYKVQPGQVVTSLETIQKKCAKDVSIQNIRTALLKLEKWGFLTSESTNRNRLITVVNWEVYQSKDKNQQADQQTTNKQLTTNKNDKELKESSNSTAAHSDDWLEDDTTPEQQDAVTQVTTHLQNKMQVIHLSNQDLNIVDQLVKEKIPTETIIEGINQAFTRFQQRNKDRPWKKINGLSYCKGSILDLHHEKTNPQQLDNVYHLSPLPAQTAFDQRAANEAEYLERLLGEKG